MTERPPYVRRQHKNALILCARIGHTGDLAIPPGYQTADCSKCGSAVWVDPSLLSAARAAGAGPLCLCNVCAPPPKPR